METLTAVNVYCIVTCSKCGIYFGLPENYQDSLRNSHDGFYCPNGHSQYYPSKSREEKLRYELKEEKRKHSQTQFELMAEQQVRMEVQNKLTKTRKRIKNGACPCCKRQFVNLHRHMQGQHPEYGQGDAGREGETNADSLSYNAATSAAF